MSRRTRIHANVSGVDDMRGVKRMEGGRKLWDERL